jgi:DHA2 family multidrug resistance protein-like MFS transporter
MKVVGNIAWDGLPMPRRIGAIAAVAFGVSISVINASIANVALPTMAQGLHVSASESIWIVNAYQIATMVALLLFSTLGDMVGYRRIYIGGLIAFALSSTMCALSVSFSFLIMARVIQGIAGSALVSVNTSLIRIIYPKHNLGRGMGINATVVAIAAVAGPTIASGILSVADWPWLFVVSVPFALLALLFGIPFLPDNPVRNMDLHLNLTDFGINARRHHTFCAFF